jgi:anti-anti-sigma factor
MKRLTRELSLAGTIGEWRPLLDDEIARIDKRPTELVLDLDGTTDMDAAALSALVLAAKRLERNGSCITLVSNRQEIRGLLRLTGLDRVFELRSAR